MYIGDACHSSFSVGRRKTFSTWKSTAFRPKNSRKLSWTRTKLVKVVRPGDPWRDETSTGKNIVCIYEMLDDATVYPITAYELEE